MAVYLPSGMVAKQYRWEAVNLQLYDVLQQTNPLPRLKAVISELIQKQSSQLVWLHQWSVQSGYPLDYRIPNAFIPPSLAELVDELYDREYQLLQEYLAYSTYFLADVPAMKELLQGLISSQTYQVNNILEIREIYGQWGESEEESLPEYWLESGYRLVKMADNLTYPTDLTFDSQGRIYVSESGFAYGTEPGYGRILQIELDGSRKVIEDRLEGPVTSIQWHQGWFYAAEGARGGNSGIGCGQITRWKAGEERQVIVSGLKSCGDHFTGEIEFGPDGRLYFTVGTATNSAVVGTDNLSWLKRHRWFHDTPARTLTLNGTNYASLNPLSDEKDIAVTGAFKPFGVPSRDGEVIPGCLYANGVLYSCWPNGTDLQIVADGFRNPFGLKFSPFSGRLYLTDNGADPRGNRPVRHDWDNFWEVIPYGWYGWPDFFSGLPAILPHFHRLEQPKPTFLLQSHPPLATQPLTRFKHHTSSNKFDFSTNPTFGYVGEAFVAQLGSLQWGHHEKPLGHKVLRVNLETGQIRNFLVNPNGEKNPAGPTRPVCAKFSPCGQELFVVDFGIIGGGGGGDKPPKPNTGALWKVVKV